MIGNTLRAIRKARQLTQEELSDLSGVRQNHISAIESGRLPNPGAVTLEKIARALGVRVEELVAGEVVEGDDLLRADRVAGLATDAGLTAEGLAQRARLPITIVQSVIEGRIGNMSLAHVVSLAQALRTSTDYLLGLTDDPAPRPSAAPRVITLNGERGGNVQELLLQLTPENRDLIVAMIERAVEISKEPP